MLEIKGLRKTYNNKIVLNDISIELDSGINVIVGLNGTGKSTLLKSISGIIKVDSGKIILKKRDITNLPPEKRNIGYVPQQPYLFAHMNIRDNIMYGLKKKSQMSDEIKEAVEFLDMEKYLDLKPSELSGGYKSRTSLLRALAIKPELMILDEPTSSLDIYSKRILIPYFKSILNKFNIPAIYVTHDPWEGNEIGDNFIFLSEGKLIKTNSSDEAFLRIKKYLA
ncbi:ATP-binding cassette domain-containing protein [Tepidibacter mesophilus]|uniref:ATP-binding cassette domain-containing protein n=1 Tax=Tepidibacter mesophilus TaxID=655607 RepID=UPI000C07D7A5|nr:ATP-binding cassette domain-containing protein [Tepidibacter mesophilus]